MALHLGEQGTLKTAVDAVPEQVPWTVRIRISLSHIETVIDDTRKRKRPLINLSNRQLATHRTNPPSPYLDMFILSLPRASS